MYGKILISMDMKVLTGMHIGGSSGFSAIGSVDSPVVRDTWTGRPMIPGSSLKGKMRYLLARSTTGGYVAPALMKEPEQMQRLFGTAGNSRENIPPQGAHLQFADCFLLDNGGAPMTEVKFENSIDRRTSVANPRQIERVVRGNRFGVKLVYDIAGNADVAADFRLIADGLKLLSMDYIGGHGSRGYGRVCFENIRVEPLIGEKPDGMDDLTAIMKDVENHAVFDC